MIRDYASLSWDVRSDQMVNSTRKSRLIKAFPTDHTHNEANSLSQLCFHRSLSRPAAPFFGVSIALPVLSLYIHSPLAPLPNSLSVLPPLCHESCLFLKCL